jgi:hypothetical protein
MHKNEQSMTRTERKTLTTEERRPREAVVEVVCSIDRVKKFHQRMFSTCFLVEVWDQEWAVQAFMSIPMDLAGALEDLNLRELNNGQDSNKQDKDKRNHHKMELHGCS